MSLPGLHWNGRRQMRWTAAVAAVCSLGLVATRVIARQGSLWEWDDFVFATALHQFAPQHQVPQPPFYPGYVYLSRLASVFLHDPILALTWVSVLASVLALVFLYGAAAELLGSRRVALAATVLFAFFPAVWLHAGVPLSDPSGLAAALGAWWLALLAVRRPVWLVPAALAFAVVVCIRPQAALVPLAALLVGAFRAPHRRAAAAVAAAGVAAFYFLPILVAAGGWLQPWRVFRYQTSFVLGAESLAAHHFDIATLVRRHLVDLWGSTPLAILMNGLAVTGAALLWRGDRRVLGGIVASFAPYAAMSWLFLDPLAAGRYGLPYLPALALLAAVALVRIEALLRIPVGSLTLPAALLSAAVVAPAVWTVHTRPSPPVAAAATVRRMAGSGPFRIVYAPSLLMHAAVLFPDVTRSPLQGGADDGALPGFLFGAPPGTPGAVELSWPHQEVLRRVGRGRYLTVTVAPAGGGVRFGEGFFGTETDHSARPGGETFHWMGSRGMLLVPAAARPRRLSFDLVVPLGALGGPPQVAITVNGVEVQRFTPESSRVHREIDLPDGVTPAQAMKVVIRTSRTFVPAALHGRGDRRVLGLQVRAVRLEPANDIGVGN